MTESRRARRPVSAARLRLRARRSWLLVLFAAALLNGAVGASRNRDSERWLAVTDVPLLCADTPNGIVTRDEWEQLPPDSRPFWAQIVMRVGARYERTGVWGFPPVFERGDAWLSAYPPIKHADDDGGFRARHAALLESVLQETIGEAETRASRGRAATLAEGFGSKDTTLFRPYWPGIGWLAGGVVAPVLVLLLTAAWAVRSTQRARRAPQDGPLCARCLYPLEVPDSAVCPECGTPVRWEYRILR